MSSRKLFQGNTFPESELKAMCDFMGRVIADARVQRMIPPAAKDDVMAVYRKFIGMRDKVVERRAELEREATRRTKLPSEDSGVVPLTEVAE